MALQTVATMVEILEQYQLHHPDVDFKNQMESLLEKARSWTDVLLRISLDTKLAMPRDSPSFDSESESESEPESELPLLERIALRLKESDSESEPEFELPLRERLYVFQMKIIEAAHKIEDVIETHIGNQILQLPSSTDNDNNEDVDSQLTHLVQQFQSIMEEISETIDAIPFQPLLPEDHLTNNSVPWYPKLDPRTRDDLTCIFEHNFRTLKAQLVEQDPSKLRIISIHGDVGMGKRTLARRLFNDPSIASHFRTRAWVTSPYDIDDKGCLLNLLEGLGMLTKDMRQKDVKELTVYIRNALKNIKYLIVIYDVADTQNLITFTSLFRDYDVGARVLFTTISSGVSSYAEVYEMPFLSDTESWLLLRQKVFGRERFPHELENIGKNILKLCTGYPQLVSLIAGVLATSEKTPAVWELVATTLVGQQRDISQDAESKLSLLIYYYLPYYLKPCLLYIGAFYESRDIKASKIIKLWIAEGFVKQIAGECLEDVAATYLQILVDKNLIYCTSEDPKGRVKAFQTKISSRWYYWMIACVSKFLGSKYLYEKFPVYEEKLARRVSVHGLSQPCDEMELPLLARSLLSVSGASRPKVSMYLKLRLLRVLEVFQLEFYQFPVEIMQQVLLRYLAFSCHSNLSNSFSILQYLQTLIIRRLPAFRAFSLPSDLWCLTQLRHVKCKETFVMIYPENGKELVHENLQTLATMQLVGVTNQFLKQIPNIRNLGIFCNVAMETAFDIACLDKLETLKCSSDWSLASRNFLAYLTFPQSMRKLNLSLCRIPSKFMEVIGSLPNLELLKLQKSDFISASSPQGAPEWETAEGEFPRLVSLEMLDLNLVHWRTKATHLPELKHLVIRNCYAMAEIPLDIGNIKTLELIQVNETSPAALVSGMQIKKEQEGRVQVRTHKVV